MLTESEVDHVADLARLAVPKDEYPLYEKQLYDILSEVNKIENVETDSEEIMISPSTNINCYSQDQIGPMLSSDDMFRNVKHSNENFIVVPRVVGESDI